MPTAVASDSSIGCGAERAHRLDRDGELRRLAGELGAAVIGREGHVDGALLAGLDADELVLEARNEAAGAELQAIIGGAAAGNRRPSSTVPTKSITTTSPFSAGRSTVSLLRCSLGDALERLVDLLVGDLGLQPLELQLGEVHRLDLGQHLDRHLVFEIGALVEG